jgi:hypothetical protein
MAKAKPIKTREVTTIPLKGGLHLRPLGDRFGVMLTSTAPVTMIDANQVEQVKALEFPKSYEPRLVDKIKAIRRILTDAGIIKGKAQTIKKDKAK